MLWVDHGLAPSEVLTAPPLVLDAAIARITKKMEQQRQEKADAEFQEVTERMHSELRSGG